MPLSLSDMLGASKNYDKIVENSLVTQEEAEKLAQKILQYYVKSCGCGSTQDVANVLMKMASVCGVTMCHVVGQEEAVQRLYGTARFIENCHVASDCEIGPVH